jgi:hypothetical protein
MADQCIVCLEDLDVVPDAILGGLRDTGSVAGLSTEIATTHPGKVDDQQQIALIKPCGHVLHDECLREWSQKANSCPMCRRTFNLVEVLDQVGGKFLFHFATISGAFSFSANCFLLSIWCSEVVGVTL